LVSAGPVYMFAHGFSVALKDSLDLRLTVNRPQRKSFASVLWKSVVDIGH
jgi:hypothetical protein